MKRNHLRIIGATLALTWALSSILLMVSCKKPQVQPGEDQATYKKRLVAIYVAQTATGLDGVSDAVDALVINDVLSKSAGTAAIGADSAAAKAWRAAKERLQAGFFDKSATDKIDEAITFVSQLESAGVIDIKDAKTKEQFRVVISGARLALTSAKNLILALNGPTFDTKLKESEQQARSFSNISVGFDLATIVMNTLGRAAQQSWLPTAQAAYDDGDAIVTALLVKNEQRLQSYKQ